MLATGGTAAATARLVEKLGGTVAGFGFVMELAFLGGRSAIDGYAIEALASYGVAEPSAEVASAPGVRD